MVGWIAFVLGLLIVGIAGANQLGYIYCLPVSVAWYILLLRASKRKKQVSEKDEEELSSSLPS